MKCSLGISSFLGVISSLTNSIVFLCFFALISEEGFLISPCCSLELCIQMGISFLFSLPLASLLFLAICKSSSDNYFAFLHFFFLGMILIIASCTVSRTSVHSSSGTLSAAAAAKSLQLCPTLCDPMDCSLPGFSVHGILQARTLEWVAISFSMSDLNCTLKSQVGSV